jgi:16S rRNA C967 or C1407 C5-methylase (RsmB/RsmF family)
MAHGAKKQHLRQGMARKTPDTQGSLAFERHVAGIYGERWPTLRQALLAPTNPEDLLVGLTEPYFLDSASVRAAQALEVKPGDRVLDMCAAPGGKTLVLALALKGTGHLVANDRSPERRARLLRVVQQHLPRVWSSNIEITGRDATRWGLYEQNVYDRVLLDAPCSSERHILNSPKHLSLWTPHRTKALAQQGLSLLCSALEVLRPGGVLVFSTCSISPTENRQLLERLEIKRKEKWTLEGVSEEFPDLQGTGPLFWARLRKNQLDDKPRDEQLDVFPKFSDHF